MEQSSWISARLSRILMPTLIRHSILSVKILLITAIARGLALVPNLTNSNMLLIMVLTLKTDLIRNQVFQELRAMAKALQMPQVP
jgi:hypothetical protein